MALREITVENLSVEIKENGDDRARVITAAVSFTAGRDDFVITIPRVTAESIKHLIDQFLLSTSNDEQVRLLVAEKNFTVDLRANGADLGGLVAPHG